MEIDLIWNKFMIEMFIAGWVLRMELLRSACGDCRRVWLIRWRFLQEIFNWNSVQRHRLMFLLDRGHAWFSSGGFFSGYCHMITAANSDWETTVQRKLCTANCYSISVLCEQWNTIPHVWRRLICKLLLWVTSIICKSTAFNYSGSFWLEFLTGIK